MPSHSHHARLKQPNHVTMPPFWQNPSPAWPANMRRCCADRWVMPSTKGSRLYSTGAHSPGYSWGPQLPTRLCPQGHTRVRFHATGRLPVPGQCAPAQGNWAILSAMGTSRLRTVQARLDCQRQLFLEESGSHSARSLPQLSETSPRSSRVLRHGALSGAQWLPNVSYERLGRRPAATRLDAGACETVIENKAFATCV